MNACSGGASGTFHIVFSFFFFAPEPGSMDIFVAVSSVPSLGVSVASHSSLLQDTNDRLWVLHGVEFRFLSSAGLFASRLPILFDIRISKNRLLRSQ